MTQLPHAARPRYFCFGAAALAAMVVLAYLPAIRTAGFIWDDPQYILENYTLRTFAGLSAIWFHPLALPQYYPLVHTTFWIEYHLAGTSPTLYHIDNILLHAAAAILLWRALLRLGIHAAWLAAAIFALHPVQVESVAWVTERKNVLSAVFYFLALLAYLNFAGNDFRSGAFRRRDYFLSLAFFLAALLSKSVACSLPAAILLLVYWRHGRLKWPDLKPLIPFFILGLLMAVVTSTLEKQHVGATGSEWPWTFSDRSLIAGRALWFYAQKLLWPHPLIFMYPQWQHMSLAQRPWLIAFPLAFAAALLALWFLRRRIGRGPLVAVLFFAGTLLPALGFINLFPMRYTFVADHYQYLACIGLIVLAAAGLHRLFGPFTPLPAAVILLLLGYLCWQQEPIYQNQLALWQDVTANNPASWGAWGNLGDEYAALSNDPNLPAPRRDAYREKARSCYLMLYCLGRDQPFAHYKWGIVMRYDGDLPAAQREFAEALRLEPRFTFAMNSMGLLLEELHEPKEAAQYFRHAIAIDPGYVEARVNYGNLLSSAGDVDGAPAQYSAAVSTRPDNVDAQFKLANLLMLEEHRPDLALPHYAAAVEQAPRRADLRVGLAAALRGIGQFDQAREQCRAALQIDPNLPEARRLWIALGGN